jgi:hypothetical protein
MTWRLARAGNSAVPVAGGSRAELGIKRITVYGVPGDEADLLSG